MTITTLPPIAHPVTRKRAERAAARGIIAGIPCVEYTITGNTFASTPYVVVDLRRSIDLHHSTRMALARRIGRAVWGEHAEPISLGNGRYELVWCNINTPLPAFMEPKYGQYHARGRIELAN